MLTESNQGQETLHPRGQTLPPSRQNLLCDSLIVWPPTEKKGSFCLSMEERGVEKWDLCQEPKDALMKQQLLLQVEGHPWLDVGKGPSDRFPWRQGMTSGIL